MARMKIRCLWNSTDVSTDRSRQTPQLLDEFTDDLPGEVGNSSNRQGLQHLPWALTCLNGSRRSTE